MMQATLPALLFHRTTFEKAPMTLLHAVVWTDHQSAQILQFDADHVQAQKVKAHSHHTAQHGSEARTQHEFFAELCTAITAIPEVLVTGSHTATADFKHYVDKHRPQLKSAIVAYEVVDHPSENQLVAMARRYFLKHNRMAGIPTPT
jgi:stalled ribosome rescue protein Dom34